MTENISQVEIYNKLNLINRDAIYNLWFLPVLDFILQSSDESWENLSADELLRKIDVKKHVPKNQLIDFCMQVYTNPTFLKDYYYSFPKKDREILLTATWQTKIDKEKLEEILGEKFYAIHSEESKYGYGKRFTVQLLENVQIWKFFFNFYSRAVIEYNEERFMKNLELPFALPTLMRQIFSQILPKPNGYYLEAFEIPDDAMLYNAEKTIFQELPLIAAYYLQGGIKYSQKGVPLLASIKKMGKTLKLEKFPFEGNSELRSTLISGLFSDNFNSKDVATSIITTLKQLLNHNITKKPFAPFLLSSIKGINRIDPFDFNLKPTAEIFKMIKDFPTDIWISAKNIKTFTETHFFDLEIITHHYVIDLIVNTGIDNNESLQISRKNILETVYYPNLMGHFYLLAALGLMEIAIDPKQTLKYSYYDNFLACRLTDLGAHIFGLKEDYKPTEVVEKTAIIFDETSLTIHVEGNAALAEAMVSNYTIKSSERRFQFSNEKFLKDCRTSADLMKKINTFKISIHQKLPALWENHFDELIVRSTAIQDKDDFITFKLQEDDKDLLRYIAQDPELKKIVIKAENFHILIPKDKIKLFYSKMRSFGYLINPVMIGYY